MKRHFGTLWTRSLFGSGTTLTDLEYKLIDNLIETLPDDLRRVVLCQFDSYNLVQREADGRALNFYQTNKGTVVGAQKNQTFEMISSDVAIVRVTFALGDKTEPVHATLHAIEGRAFCVTFNRRIDCYPSQTFLQITDVTESWRSTVKNSYHLLDFP